MYVSNNETNLKCYNYYTSCILYSSLNIYGDLLLKHHFPSARKLHLVNHLGVVGTSVSPLNIGDY